MNKNLYRSTTIKDSEDVTCEIFEFKNEYGHIKHIFIKYKVNQQIDGKVYYKLKSPSGFGGPKILNCPEEQKWDLIFEFTRAFEEYCLNNQIVYEEVEFLLPYSNPIDFLECYEIEYIKDRKGIDLTESICQIEKEDLSKLWNAVDAGIEYRILEGDMALQTFKDFSFLTNKSIYTNLDCFLRYGSNCNLTNYIAVELSINDKVIAMSYSQVHENEVYTQWIAQITEVHDFDLEKVLKCTLYLTVSKRGYRRIWNSINDNHSILTLETLISPICIGKKVWNKQVFKQLLK